MGRPLRRDPVGNTSVFHTDYGKMSPKKHHEERYGSPHNHPCHIVSVVHLTHPPHSPETKRGEHRPY